MTAPPDHRLDLQEAALLDLLERMQVLERALRFEIQQRAAMEELVLRLSGIPGRVDRLERVNRTAQRRGAA